MWRWWSSRRDSRSRWLPVWAAGGLQTLLSGSQRLCLQCHHVPVRAKEPLQLPRQQLLPAGGPVQAGVEPRTLPRREQEWWACPSCDHDEAAMLIDLGLQVWCECFHVFTSAFVPPSLQSGQRRVQTPSGEGPFKLGSRGGHFVHQRRWPSGPGTPRWCIQETREDILYRSLIFIMGLNIRLF